MMEIEVKSPDHTGLFFVYYCEQSRANLEPRVRRFENFG